MQPTPFPVGATADATAQPTLDNVRSSDPAIRLLEDSWQTRSSAMSHRELVLALHSFGDDAQAERLGQLHDRRDDRVPDRRGQRRALVSRARTDAPAPAAR